jgi:hypothetical protein
MNILHGFSPLSPFAMILLVSPVGFVAAFLVPMFLCLSIKIGSKNRIAPRARG